MKSIFLKKEGETPKNKVLDFLIVHSDFDYSLKDISQQAKMGYTTIKLLYKELIRDHWIVFTRKVGKAMMYKLNMKCKKVHKFIDYYWQVIDEEINKESCESNDYVSSGPIAVPMGTRNI